MASMPQTDPCRAIISQIAAYGTSSIPVPALSKLLGVNSTTLNARFRREQIPLRTVGRTSYLPRDRALQLVELHRYALIGWPTLLAASKLTDVKPATLKAKCEKGQLEGHIDLTKRLRLNPAALEALCSLACLGQAKSKTSWHGTRAKCPPGNNIAKALAPAGMKAEPWRLEAERAPDIAAHAPSERTPLPQANAGLSPAPEPKITILRPKDYGFPEVESRPQTASQRPPPSEVAHKKSPCLVYDPLQPFSLSACSLGKTIRYDQYVGTVLKLIDDPYVPRIKVAFPEHVDPEMREVLLVVDKKKRPGVLE